MSKLSEEEYQNLKKQLSPDELKEIEVLEKNCEELSIDYWKFYGQVENYKVGIRWTVELRRQLRASPMFKLRMHLLDRAAELRNIKFNE